MGSKCCRSSKYEFGSTQGVYQRRNAPLDKPAEPEKKPINGAVIEVTDDPKTPKKQVQFATMQSHESHRSDKRVSVLSVDSCDTISSCSSHSNNSNDGQGEFGDSLPSFKSDVTVEDLELEFGACGFDSLEDDNVGELQGLLRRTPRQQLPYKSSVLGREVNRSTSQDEIIHWKRGNRLGRGSFGTVFLGLTKTGELIAVKQVGMVESDSEDAEKEYTKIFQEVTLLRSLVHDNIVKYLGSTYENNTVSIFTEFIPGGSLATIIEKFGPLEMAVTARYTCQLLSAVTYMHENSVVHRDIKSANIMLMPNGTVKLIDFGCAKRLALRLSRSGSHLQKSLRGTPYWMAPEVVNDSGHGRKSDIWGDREPIAAMYAIGSDDFPVPTLPESFPPRVREFVQLCMMRDKYTRPQAKQLQDHTFVTPPFFDESADNDYCSSNHIPASRQPSLQEEEEEEEAS